MSEPEEKLSRQLRVASAKRAAEAVAELVNSPASALMPDRLKAALGELVNLLPELAILSHAKFDMSPFDFPELVRRVESLESFKANVIRRAGGALSEEKTHG